jgi:hypothetical protein
MDHHHGARMQRRAAYAFATGLSMATFLAAALLSPIGAQYVPRSQPEIICDVPIDEWETELPPFVAPPVVMEGTEFSRILKFWDGAATLLYNSVDASEGRRKVTLYMQGFGRIVTFHASHVYVDRLDHETEDGWLTLSLLFIDATQSVVHRVSFWVRLKQDGTAGVEEFRVNPVESFPGRCYK